MSLPTPESRFKQSPDLILYNHCTRVGEIKLTWLSCGGMPLEVTNGFPPKFDKYVTQMALYCHCLETPYARLLGYFVNGDYAFLRKTNRHPPGPMLRAWNVEFTARELHEEWARAINHAKHKRLL